MGRYIGTSPFQDKSLVWSVNNGLVIKNGDAAGIVEKPEFLGNLMRFYASLIIAIISITIGNLLSMKE